EVSLGKFIFECMVEHSLLKLGYHSSAFCLFFRGYILALRVCVLCLFFGSGWYLLLRRLLASGGTCYLADSWLQTMSLLYACNRMFDII
ncbi:unnamed protein product, partial [Brassica oleracea]